MRLSKKRLLTRPMPAPISSMNDLSLENLLTFTLRNSNFCCCFFNETRVHRGTTDSSGWSWKTPSMGFPKKHQSHHKWLHESHECECLWSRGRDYCPHSVPMRPELSQSALQNTVIGRVVSEQAAMFAQEEDFLFNLHRTTISIPCDDEFQPTKTPRISKRFNDVPFH